MILWLIFAGLTLAVLAALLLPLLRRPPPAAARSAFDIQVYRQQLGELDRDSERGMLAADQRDAAQGEIHRRILAAAAADPATPPSPPLRPLWRALTLAIGLPLLAGVLYLSLGSPSLPGRPFAARQSDPALKMAALTDQLAARLAAAPDGEGFRRLGDAYMMQQRFADAARAYQQAQGLGVADSTLLSAQGEAILMSNDGMVMPEARHLLQRALALDRQNPQARFYLGLAEAQIGDLVKAVAIWRDLEAGSAAGAPWLPSLRQHIAEVAKQGGFDPAGVAPQPPPAAAEPPPGDAALQGLPPGVPSAAAAAIAAQSPDEQARTIRAMVERLAARLEQQPDDAAGWLRLTQSYLVLGDRTKAKAAALRAVALRPNDVDAHLALAQAELGDAPENALPADFVATLKQVLALDPANGTALYYLGAAAAAAGQNGEARRLWQTLLTQTSADLPEHADLAQRIKALPEK